MKNVIKKNQITSVSSPWHDENGCQHGLAQFPPLTVGSMGISRQLILISWTALLLTLVSILMATVADAATIAQSPLFLTSTVKPNIMLMVDNSGSMRSTVAHVPTTYDPGTTYLAPTDCTQTANRIPATTSSSSTVITSDTTKGTCESNGGTWSKKNNRCTKVETKLTPITYTTTVPKTFLGNVTGSGRNRVVGTQCFASNVAYTITSASDFGMPSTVTTDEQRANFLNWYYKEKLDSKQAGDTRLNIAKAASVALVNSLDGNVRVGLSTFGNTTSDPSDTAGGKLLEAIDDLSATKKKNIQDAINNLTAISWTPLAETVANIGRYFATGSSNVVMRRGITGESTQATTTVFPKSLDDGTDWRTIGSSEPKFSTAPIQFSCQKSFNILVTDGQPTQDRDVSSLLRDYDGDCSGANSSNCLSATPNYDLKKAYFSSVPGDNGTDYMDDVSQALFEMDLRPDLVKKADKTDNVIREKNNVITYSIGFADASINPTIAGVNPILRDAAVQSGGKFFYAANASELSASLQQAITSILRQDASSSSVAANSTQFQTNSLLFQALFDTTTWSGNVKAIELLSEDTNGNGKLDKPTDIPPLVTVTEDTNGNGVLDIGIIGSERWDAASRMLAPGVRTIFTYDPKTDLGVEFFWDKLNSAQKNVLDSVNEAKSGPNDSPILNFLRGDRTIEGSEPGDLRIRDSILGDVINSDPLFVASQDFGYSTLPTPEGPSYQDFVTTVKKANQDMLYVGANDGMLHAFQVSTSLPDAEEGVEVFAYLPNVVISKELASLAEPNYFHNYFVDGGPQYSDVYFDGGWHSVLVGTMGAGRTTPVGDANGTGGMGVFAIDITHPADFAPEDVLWEFTNRHDADLGYTLPQPSIVRMGDSGNHWAAIVANGYQSANGKAVLFILDIKTGAVLRKIQAGTDTVNNGLSSPTPIDVDGDRIVDYIYAGDLKGNLWKFDVTNKDIAQWGVAYSGNPLFVALDIATPTPARQVITSKPAVAKANGKEQNSGVMVLFGTGKYYEQGDHQIGAGSQIQTFYGIWDVCDKSTPVTCNGIVGDRSVLVEQKISEETNIAAIDQDIRLTTICEVPFGPTYPSTTSADCPRVNNQKGWYMDLKSPVNGAEGERVVSNPLVRNNVLVFTTLIPINKTCEPDGTGWFMEMNITGARFISSQIDINNDSKIDANDLYNSNTVTGFKSKDGIIDTPTIVGSGGGNEKKYLNTTSSKLMGVLECPPEGCPPPPCEDDDPDCGGGGGIGNRRKSWRQLR